MDVKVFKDKHISWWFDQENLIYARWNSIKTVNNNKEADL